MEANNSAVIDEQVLKSLGARTIRVIRSQKALLKDNALSKLEELDKMSAEGSSKDGLVTIKINGNHQVMDISFHHSFTDWAVDNAKTCKLIIEAINDGISKIDLNIEKEIFE
ncbi:hypothetical protein EP47_07040 [Legionella norrlandica]|uniref:Uncharacterized protein n=1 Tax=Legionella norrlandica TaxID=1498499 RepID=A0A0A2SW13_9GAMM|nr:YbaB/EbfC family nucleoid-associated protein [Legionella norrlandica]KGP63886.1 hypothetical protein EP47_07040 [Legionella norrlandica]